MSDRPWQIHNDRLVLRVRLTPKASRDGIDGVEVMAAGPVLKARVRAVPADGKANAALEDLVARSLRVPKSTVSVTSGATSRIKVLAIAGNPQELAALLAQQFGPST